MKVATYLVSVAVVVAAMACGGPQPAEPSPTASGPTVGSLVDARWMGWQPNESWNWEEIERRIAPDLQRFGFRPLGENRGPRWCQGCGDRASTAEVTVYAPGKFDPADARTGQPVAVDGREGFFRAAEWDQTEERNRDHDAMLTWQYADSAWATVRGMSDMTSSLDRLLELARALRPNDRTPVRLPLSLANLPANMPLASIYTSNVRIMGPSSEYGTMLEFAPCGALEKGDSCYQDREDSALLSVQIWHRDDYTDSDVRNEVPHKIGGKDGRYDKRLFWAAVLVPEGLYVEFDLIPPRDPKPTTEQEKALSGELEEILNSVGWAPDTGNEATWPLVSDWAK